ncbi:hypothetical protein MMC26_005691 [Xylographa opegraphella]|nr:hypothetical protein [Xylographa opegraphella]
MPLPPEFLKLKRKRNEELPDTLFIQKEHRDPKRNFTDTAWQFRLVGGARSISSSVKPESIAAHYTQTSKATPQVPIVRATLPGEEDLKIKRKEHYRHDSAPRPDYDRSSALFQDVSVESQALQVTRKAIGPRRFHLTKDSVSYTHQVRATKQGILKHKKNVHANLPVFSEQTKELLSVLVSDTSSLNQDTEIIRVTAQHTKVAQVETKSSIKRPNVSAVEKQWRARNWQKQVQRPTSEKPLPRAQAEEEFLATQREYETLKLAAELQKFALQQTQGDTVSNHVERQAKVKPKPLSGRHVHGPIDHGLLDSRATEGNQENETEWIVETYVREAKPAPANSVSPSAVDSYTPASDFGLLVIPEEDEPAWEVFGEDEGGDSDLSSDGSDSNAEDYYANDYPEDEINSDDEYGRGASRYRHADSDDEEYDEDVMSYSDEEETKPWKRGLWSGGDVNADDHKGGTGLALAQLLS